jgi:hypothetical protein
MFTLWIKKPSQMAELKKSTFEDVFDRFSDPLKKRKRKRKKETVNRVKRRKIFMSGKEFAVDHFNTPLTSDCATDLLSFVSIQKPKPTIEELKRKYENIQVSDIGFSEKKSQRNSQGMDCIFNFIMCAGHCQKWMAESMEVLGWTKNATNYNPISASHSVNELTQATVEWYKIACKQMIKVREWQQSKKNRP